MERIVITIYPTPSDEGLLRVSDAMQQVIDTLKLCEEANRAMASPQESFEWRLERASTNTPFTVVAVAEAVDPAVDVSAQVRRVKSEVSSGIRKLIKHSEPTWWMGPEAITLARSMFVRTQNGIAITEIEFEPTEKIAIDRTEAAVGIRAIAGISAINLDAEIGEREAMGEIEGVMVAAGRYRGRPAIQIRSEMYHFVWCPLSPEITQRFGSEHRMAEVWEGRRIGVQGRLIYASGGKLSKIEVTDIREIEGARPIDLDSVLDPDFTAGLDPIEYLRQFHEGQLT
jgi:hypothetical protein